MHHPLPKKGTVLGFDFGVKRIGVAVANIEVGHVEPLMTLENHYCESFWKTLNTLVETWKPTRLIVGKTDTVIEKQIMAFAQMLKKRYACPVEFSEEAYTSTEAKLILRELRVAGRSKKVEKGDLDKLAAALILKTWLSNQGIAT